MSFSYTIPAMKLNWFAFLRAFYRRSSSQTKPTVECFFNTMKDIPWFEWLYAITEDGNVWSYARHWRKESWFLRPWKNKCWYLQLHLLKSWKHTTTTVHRLVWITFIPNPENKPQINHIDWNKLNNYVSNLEWCTNAENQKHKRHVLWKKNKCLETSPKKVGKYSKEWIFLSEYLSVSHAARENTFAQSNISKACLWVNKTAYWFIWKFI